MLKQALRRQYVVGVVLISCLSNALLTALGCGGVGTALAASSYTSSIVGWLGFVFLLAYGAKSFWSARTAKKLETVADESSASKSEIVSVTLAVAFFNPHLYLDVFVFLPSVASNLSSEGLLAFTVGACSAAVLWFILLGTVASRLAAIFQGPKFWRRLDILVGILMWYFAFKLFMTSDLLG